MGRQQLVPEVDHLREVDGHPAHAAVVDPPELRLEALAERDDRRACVLGQKAPHRLVEASRAKRLPLGKALAVAEALCEGKVDALDELDREGIVEHRVGPARLCRPMPERPQEGLGNGIESNADARHRLRP
jgi:hypothetical protein